MASRAAKVSNYASLPALRRVASKVSLKRRYRVTIPRLPELTALLEGQEVGRTQLLGEANENR